VKLSVFRRIPHPTRRTAIAGRGKNRDGSGESFSTIGRSAAGCGFPPVFFLFGRSRRWNPAARENPVAAAGKTPVFIRKLLEKQGFMVRFSCRSSAGRRPHEKNRICRKRSMNWEIFYHHREGYIEVVTSGPADKESSLSMAKELNHAMRSNRLTKALIDHRKISSVAGSIIDIYQRPKILRILGVLLHIKIAEIIRPDHREHFHLLGDAGTIQGYQFSIFEDRDAALRWLLSP
jgi:hypothetical protein